MVGGRGRGEVLEGGFYLTGDVSDYIQTRSGKKFHFMNPRPEEVDIEDIAYALAHTTRWGGHCDPPITVAQHCVLVSRLLRDGRCSAMVQMQGLLHDAAEAYIPDIPSPIKPYLKDLAGIDWYIERAICEAFGVHHPFDPAVKRADVESYRWEYRDLMKQVQMCTPPAERRPTLSVWSADESEMIFLNTFDVLKEVLDRELAA